MTYAITKYTKQQIATLDTPTLAHSVQLFTDKMLKRCIDAEKTHREAKTAQERKMALAKVEEAHKAWDDYLEEQKAMAIAMGAGEHYHERRALIPTGEYNENGKEIIRTVEREIPVGQIDAILDRVYAEDEKAMNDSPDWESDDDWERAGEEE